jgi:hypothetical protein
MTYKITETDALTGVSIEREATIDEIIDFEAREQKIENIKIEAEAKAEAKSALLDRLGITEDEAKLLLS